MLWSFLFSLESAGCFVLFLPWRRGKQYRVVHKARKAWGGELVILASYRQIELRQINAAERGKYGEEKSKR